MTLYDIYSFCRNIFFIYLPAHLLALCCFCVIFGSIMTLFFKKKRKKFLDSFRNLDLVFGESLLRIFIICLLSSFVILFSSPQFVIWCGSEDIRLMPEGTYCYYVYATNKKDKTYTLPAKIEKGFDLDEFGDGEYKYTEYYRVRNVYFKNGGYLYFEE